MAKEIYVGAEGVARKVKKAYVGVEGQTIVEEENLTKFTSNPIPTTWVDSEDYLSATATDEYGEWSIVANSLYNNSQAYRASKAVDGNTTSYWRSKGLDNTGYEAILTLTLPERVKIKPTTISIIHENLGNADYHSVLEAYNGSEYVTLETLANTTPSSGGTGQITKTIELSGTDYFSQFRLTLYRCGGNSAYNSPIIYSFEITAGTLKKITQSYASKSFAHKVKKGYIGVAGIARPFFSAEPKLEYYGTTNNLATARASFAATTVGDYALFGGGFNGSKVYATVDTYTSSLVKGTAADLTTARQTLAATTVGDYALFGGGYDGSTYSAIVNTYTSSLVRTNATKLSVARQNLAATTVGNYALFGGGKASSESKVVDTYTSSLVKGTATDLSNGRWNLAATTVGDYALFGGGGNTATSTYRATVDTYNANLVKGTATNLSTAKYQLAATSVGDYALFGGGGTNNTTPKATVDTYTLALVKGTTTNLSVSCFRLAATSVGDYALFGGGHDGSDKIATVDAYTSSLVKETTADLSDARHHLAATSVGDYALFGGGNSQTTYVTTVDVYQYA